MGFATGRKQERAAAAMGGNGTSTTRFESNNSVANGGVLLALPALLGNGALHKHAEHFSIDGAHYYRTDQLLLIFCLLILGRVENFDKIQEEPVGEWGKLMGIDRIPVAKTLRLRLGDLCKDPAKVAEWTTDLSQLWLKSNPDDAGCLYIDGHMRLYHGRQTKLPRHFVSRQRLCLRATCDYWVNDRSGQPIFVNSTPHSDGMLAQLSNDVIPRLLKEVPQPSQEELDKNPLLCVFKMVFDREGYSPDFIKKMWVEHRVACQTYHKFPKEDWPEDEFFECTVNRFHSGENIMRIAERGVHLSGKIWLREIRKLNASGRQTSLLSTDFTQDSAILAADMFDRWTQENFFAYAMKHLGIDKLVTYETEEVNPQTLVPNPRYRQLTNEISGLTAKINRRRLKLAAIEIDEQLDEKKIAKASEEMLTLTEEIEDFEKQKEELKSERKTHSKKILFENLEEQDKFRQLHRPKQQFMNALRIICYRAETSLSNILRQEKRFCDSSRTVVRDILSQNADIEADEKNGTLTIILHHFANNKKDEAAERIIAELNACESIFPGTNMKIIYAIKK